jgi:hypothetical protein
MHRMDIVSQTREKIGEYYGKNKSNITNACSFSYQTHKEATCKRFIATNFGSKNVTMQQMN